MYTKGIGSSLGSKMLIAASCVITSECEVIQTFVTLKLDCYASLAMTMFKQYPESKEGSKPVAQGN